jgi:hypothetical protein
MIYKVGGYTITFRQCRKWMKRNDIEWRGSVLAGTRDILDKPLKTSTDPAANWYRIICTDYPKKSPDHEGTTVLMFITTTAYDRRATIDEYTQFEETDRYRAVKNFLKESGLGGELTFVTVPDPHFWYRRPSPEDCDIMYF